MTGSPWTEIAVAVTAVQVSQALALRPMSALAIATLTAGPSLVITVMLVTLWITGVSLQWVIVSAVGSLGAQIAVGRIARRRQDRKAQR